MIKLSISKYPIENKDKSSAINLTAKFSMLYNLREFIGTENDLAKLINQGYIIIPATFRKNIINKKGDYTRCYDNFSGLNTLFIDIDNKSNNVDYTINNPNHISIEDAKQALNDLGLDWFIIYTTLSHSEEQHKFRIGFRLKETVSDIKKAKALYLDLGATLKPLNVEVDARALEPSRLFFPGIVLEVKENSFLDINRLQHFEKCSKKNNSKKSANIKTNKLYNDKKDLVVKEFNFTLDEILAYINNKITASLDIDYFKRYDILNNILDLTELFNVEEYDKFSCIFHKDTNPSAYIYKNENDISVYHCFSCDERLNGVQLVKRLFDLDEYTFNLILEKNTKIRIGSEYQKKVANIAMATLMYISDNKGFESDNEIVFKYFRRRRLFLILESLYLIGNLNATIKPLSKDDKGICFFSSISYIKSFYNNKYGTNLTDDNIRLKINTLANLGMISKLHIDELQDDVKENALKWMKDKGFCKYPNFYFLTPITINILKHAEDIILLEKKAGVKAKNQSKKQSVIIQKDNADKIYVQNKIKYDIDKEDLFIEVIKYLSSMDKEWFNLKEVYKNIDRKRKYRKSYKERQIELYITKLILEKKVLKIRCSGANKLKYNIPDKYTHYEILYIWV